MHRPEEMRSRSIALNSAWARILPACLAALLLAACSAGNSPLPDRVDGLDSLSLAILPETYQESGQLEGLRLRQSMQAEAGRLEVDVVADRASRLRALYFRLEYDSRILTPVEVRGAALGAGQELLCLSDFSQPGRIESGQQLIHPAAQKGYSGSGVLATVSFELKRGNAVRETSKVPLGAGAKAPLVWLTPGAGLRWYYSNPGDYSQDGEAGIADLTPLGIHFGASGPFDPGSALYMVDGDGNGEIGISDVTVLGQNLGHRVEGYRVYSAGAVNAYPDNPAGQNGNGSLQLASVPLQDSISGSAQRRSFELSLSPAVSGPAWIWLRPFEGSSEGTPSNYVSVEASGDPGDPGDDPGADPGPDNPGTLKVGLYSDKQSGSLPLEVNFSASVGDIPDGIARHVEFDFDGNGTFETDNGTKSYAGHTFAQKGLYFVKVRVTEDDGDFGTAVRQVNAGGLPNLPPLASFTVSTSSCIAPARVRLDASGSVDAENGVVQYIWDLNGDSSADSASNKPYLDWVFNEAGDFVIGLTVRDGLGAEDSATASIHVSDRKWLPQTVYEAADIQKAGETSIVAVRGSLPGLPAPAIAAVYRDSAGSHLGYFYGGDISGEFTAPRPIMPAVSGNYWGCDLLSFGESVLAAAYYQSVPGGPSRIASVRSSSSAGTSWDMPQMVLSSGAGWYARLDYGFELPLMIFSNTADNHISASFGSGPTGEGSWGEPHDLYPGTQVLGYELASRDGLPAMLLAVPANDSGRMNVHYLFADYHGPGYAWHGNYPVAKDAGATSVRPSLAFCNGFPCAAYVDADDGTLRFAQAVDVEGKQWFSAVEVAQLSPGNILETAVIQLAEVNGVPALAWYDPGSASLYYRAARDVTGHDWAALQTIETNNHGGRGLSLSLFGGQPRLAYWQGEPPRLKYASSGAAQ